MSHGLTPRPELCEEELFALQAVSEELLKEQELLAIEEDEVPIWRFSGRWFNAGPYANRRPLAVSR
jgi:hypothetical protein